MLRYKTTENQSEKENPKNMWRLRKGVQGRSPSKEQTE
jgi:hypothetical protein